MNTTTEVLFANAWADVLGPALARRGANRVLVLASAGRRGPAEAMVAALGDRSVGLFAEAAEHVPRELAERAVAEVERLDADTIVAVGGGSVIGLGKAIQWLRGDARRLGFAVLPTTYAGSEMTSIWGLERADGTGKEVGRDPVVRPDLVIYDPALSATLPAKIAIPSLFNAMAHAVDALFPLEPRPGSPGLSADQVELAELAERAIAQLAAAIVSLGADPDDAAARRGALAGAHKAGQLLERAGMSLHHKLAHVLGGRFNLNHAGTHTILLPHVVAWMAPAAPEALGRIGRALAAADPTLDGADPARSLWDLQARVGVGQQLRELGLERAGIELALPELLAAKIVSPRSITAEPIRELLLDAWLGRRPSVLARRLTIPALSHASHSGIRPALAGEPLASARAAVICVHGRGSTAEAMISKLGGLLGGAAGPTRGGEDRLPAGLAVVAIQADARSWYDHGYAEPVARNQPRLDGALELLATVRRELAARVDPRKTVLWGFSQGACLVLDQFARTGGPTAGVVAIAGALIGEHPVEPWHGADLSGARVVVGVAEHDRWVARDRVEASANHLERHGALVERDYPPGDAHEITRAQAQRLHELIRDALA